VCLEAVDEAGNGNREYVTAMAELRIVRAEGGDPYLRGTTIGAQLRDPINESIDFYHRYLHRRGVDSTELQELLTPYLVAAETTFPDSMATLKGMSVGAMVPVLELFAINAFEELEPLLQSPEGGLLFLQKKEGYLAQPASPAEELADLDPEARTDSLERCSSFTVAAPGKTLIAHNEHWLAGDAANVAVIIDVPEHGVPVASPTVVCCLPAVGVNGHGGGQGIGSLTAADDKIGVPRVLVSRSSLEARDRADAVARAGLPNRAGGYGHVFGFAGGDTLAIETTGNKLSVLDGPGPHTNHYLSRQLAELAPPASEGSRARYERLGHLLEERRPSSVEDVMEIMRDHASSPQAICLHPDPQEGDEASAVMFSMVADLEAGRMWVAAGTPCELPYQEIDLTDVR
jgi:isopenicillin-N N-acyltransferase like protein